MKPEQTTSWLYFCMLNYTDASLPLLAGFACAKPISNIAMPVSKCSGEKFLVIWLCLAPAQDPEQLFG